MTRSRYELLFDYAKLDDVRKKSLEAILLVLLLDGECEIEVNPVEFPDKFQVNLDCSLDGCGFVIVWDDEKSGYRFFNNKHECLLAIVLPGWIVKKLSKLLRK